MGKPKAPSISFLYLCFGTQRRADEHDSGSDFLFENIWGVMHDVDLWLF
jgi:hypothetical protein